MIKKLRLDVLRIISRVFPFKSLQLSEWAFNPDSRWAQAATTVRLFGFDCPLWTSRSVTQRLLCLEGERFIEERDLLKGLLNPGDVVVDVGANIGYLSLLFQSKIGSMGKLICIEPDQDNFGELKNCLEVNGFDNTFLINAAVGDTSGFVTLKSGLNGHITEDGDVQVKQITLDSLIEYKPNFVKIDVEGYEATVLDGAQQLLSTLKPTLFLELHPYLVPRRSMLREIAKSLNTIYSDVEYFEYKATMSWLEKIFVRYGLVSPIKQLNEEDIFDAVERGERDQPFWAVCRS